MQRSLVSPWGQGEAQVRTHREALLTIRDQLHQPGECFLVLKNPTGSSWKSEILVIPRARGASSSGDRHPKLWAEWQKSFRVFPGPSQKERPMPGTLCPCSCCWPGSPSSPKLYAKDWSHSHLLFQGLLCDCARSWALAPFHLFGEDEFCQGHANHQ